MGQRDAHLTDVEELRQASAALASLSLGCLSELLKSFQDVETPDDVQADSLLVMEGFSSLVVENEAAFLGAGALPRKLPPPSWSGRDSGQAKVVSRANFLRVLTKFPNEAKIFERFAREAATFLAEDAATWHESLEEDGGQRLLAFLAAAKEFEGCQPGFPRRLLEQTVLRGKLLGPGELLAPEELWTIVLAGRIQVESQDGILLRYAGPGEVLVTQHVVRAVTCAGPALCLQLSKPKDLGGNDDVTRWLRNVQQLQAEELEAMEQRRSWVHKVAMPALSATQLLRGCPEDFLRILGGQLTEETFSEHQEIVACNTAGNSMLVVLEGLVELRAKSGKQVGCISPGAVLGEPEALGLLSYRTATAKAVTDCRLMPVSFQALRNALEHPHTAPAFREGFRQLVEGRKMQVEERKPLAGLMHIRNWEEDVGANLLALRAERLPLESGDCWQPSHDSEASGPRISLVLRGRVELKISGTTGPPVEVNVRTGSVVPEGMLASHGAVLHALSADCEVYRLWQFDLIQAAFITQQAPDWFYQLRVLEEETRAYLQSRLTNARGLVQGRWRHPTDVAIRGWAEKKRENLRRAQKRQEEFYENYLGPKLPLLPPKKLGSTAFRSWGDLPPIKPTKSGPGRNPPRGPSPSAFRALNLQRGGTRSEPMLRRL